MKDRVSVTASGSDVLAATLWGLAVAFLLIGGIYLGSRGFRDFDPALVSYAGASVFAAFGIGYRYAMWLRRPPTRLYWRRGWEFIFAPRRLFGNLLHLIRLFWDNFVLQVFIERRSPLRWTAHWLISWGCLLAAAITFPLSFGWIRFESARHSQSLYEMFVFGIRLARFPVDGPAAWLTFNALNIAAVMVLAGVILAFARRSSEAGALAVQQFADDLLPLVLLFAVAITGLLLTASTHLMRGYHYGFLSQFHAVMVILTLIYLPFGKLFHVFQRPAQFGVNFYRQAGAEAGAAVCARCGGEFASRLHVNDLKQVEAALGIRFETPGAPAKRAGHPASLGRGVSTHYQDVCPTCRRKNLALIQDALWREARGTLTPEKRTIDGETSCSHS